MTHREYQRLRIHDALQAEERRARFTSFNFTPHQPDTEPEPVTEPEPEPERQLTAWEALCLKWWQRLSPDERARLAADPKRYSVPACCLNFPPQLNPPTA